jgi:hypothetical protein
MNLREARQVIDSLDADPDALAVFGQQYQTPDGATVIPVSKPIGVFVIKDGKPIWSPAKDDTRIALFGILVGLVAAALAGIAMVRRPPWPDLHGEVSKRL